MIRMEELTRHFGAVEAVHDLTLDVPRGELFCFLGPNGAGKTTTIKMLCGLLRPTRGRIRIKGMDLFEDPVAVRRITGYIPDSPYLYDRLTVEEFFEFIGQLYRVPDDLLHERGIDLFRAFGLSDMKETLIKDLSHGLRQRLVYASTFLHDPEVLFVDEPFVGLDPYSIRQITTLLREKTRVGMTVFLTTHILALAQDMADRIGIITQGRLVALGTLEEIKEQTSSRGGLEEVFLALTSGGPEG